MVELQHIEVRPGIRIAVDAMRPKRATPVHPGFFWLGGFRSDMTGSKASRLRDLASWGSRPFVRFDYSGHGQSGGRFEDCTLSNWLDETEQVFALTEGWPMILIGSSMGGYLALLLARRLKEKDAVDRVKGIVLVAPAPDMTEALMWQSADETARNTIMKNEVWLRPSAYGDPYPITRKLIEDGRKHLLLDEGLDLDMPVRILHGDRDEDVPWQHGLRTFNALRGHDIQFTLIKDGDHRLSRDQDIWTIYHAAEKLAIQAATKDPNPSR